MLAFFASEESPQTSATGVEMRCIQGMYATDADGGPVFYLPYNVFCDMSCQYVWLFATRDTQNKKLLRNADEISSLSGAE